MRDISKLLITFIVVGSLTACYSSAPDLPQQNYVAESNPYFELSCAEIIQRRQESQEALDSIHGEGKEIHDHNKVLMYISNYIPLYLATRPNEDVGPAINAITKDNDALNYALVQKKCSSQQPFATY